jgi:phosphoglycerate kinase
MASCRPPQQETTMAVRVLEDLDLDGKRVLLRADFNVPLKDGRVTDDTRIRRTLATIQALLDGGAKVIVLSHLGRPKGRDPALTLRPIAAVLAALLGREVAFAEDCIGPKAEAAIAALPKGGVLLLENLRFHPGEEANDPAFVAALAKLGDAYVNDAFSTAHRAHASTEGLAHKLPAAAGRLMQEELEQLARALTAPQRPLVAIVGGAKVSTKLDLLENLVGKVDTLVIGGGMANTFIFAEGHDVGRSLCEKDMAETARRILAKAKTEETHILLPIDTVVAPALQEGVQTDLAAIDAIPADQMILDIGPQTLAAIEAALKKARTVVWNGPFGAFEVHPFEAATMEVAGLVSRLTKAGFLVSVAGGGDTVAALAMAKVEDDLSYVSTAGGAFLEWLEGKQLPGVKALEKL